MQLSPAEYVIHVFKGVRPAARAIGRCPASVSRWKEPKSKRGLDGNVPHAVQRKILELAKAFDLDITPDDLIHGRRISKKKMKS